MRETNNPDVALAWEWLDELESWVEENGLEGYDPLLIEAYPFIRTLINIPFIGRCISHSQRVFPPLFRKMFILTPVETAEAHALMAIAYLRLYQIDGNTKYLEKSEYHLTWLRSKRISTGDGWSWGYPFPYSIDGVKIPPNTPISEVTGLVGNAYAFAYELTGVESYLNVVLEVAKFFVEVLPSYSFENGSKCFAYALKDGTYFSYSANVLVGEFLHNVFRLTNDKYYKEISVPAVEFILRNQNEDGSWYSGFHKTNSDFSTSQVVIGYQLGVILRALYSIYKVSPSDEIKQALLKGFHLYAKQFFSEMGQPLFSPQNQYPVDIRACAEGILCPSYLYEIIQSAHVLAVFVLRWSWFYMRDRNTGDLYYRRHRFTTSKITFPRWGVAWVFRALAEYLYHFHSVKERVERLKLQSIRWLPDPKFFPFAKPMDNQQE
ncbi:MAG: hypothetical protein N3G21_00875 [Candidatus Hydrogenedentes bacterium]|nr:hypothetical protein [Candidatus Hydrogenedentota bacterium]